MAEDRGIEALAYAEVAGWFMGRADGAKLAALRDAYLSAARTRDSVRSPRRSSR
jgi:hypothetical protein